MTQAGTPQPDALEARVANLELLMQFMAETQRIMADNIVKLTEHQQRYEDDMKQVNERLDVQQGQIKVMLERLLGESK